MYTKNSITTYNLQSHTDEGFKFSDEFVSERGMYKLNQTLDYDSLQYSPSLDYPIEINGEIFYPGNSYEKYMERKMEIMLVPIGLGVGVKNFSILDTRMDL